MMFKGCPREVAHDVQALCLPTLFWWGIYLQIPRIHLIQPIVSFNPPRDLPSTRAMGQVDVSSK